MAEFLCYRVTIRPLLLIIKEFVAILGKVLECPSNFMGQKKREVFPSGNRHLLACGTDPASSLRLHQPLSIKLREREPFRKGGAGPAARHLGNCSRPGSSRLNTTQRSRGDRASSRKREGTEGPSGGALGRRASKMGMVVRGRDSEASSRAPRRISGPLYPTGRARAGAGEAGPGLRQIKSKERNCRLSKSTSLRHHPPPCGEQVVSEVRAARSAWAKLTDVSRWG